MPDLKIAVIGAGIGGLVTSLAFQRQGHRVTLYEKEVQPKASGSGLSLFANAIKALNGMDLLKYVPDYGADQAQMIQAGQRTPDGKWLLKLPRSTVDELRVVSRPELHQAFLGQLAPGTLQLGCEVLIESSEQGILRLQWLDGIVDNEQFDLIVAADGIHSVSRKILSIDPGIKYAGYTAWRGMADPDFDYDGNGGATWGKGEHFGYSPMTDGRFYWFATATKKLDEPLRSDRAELQRRFFSWHDPIEELIHATPDQDLLRHDIYFLKQPLKTFIVGKVLLLGDAAHAMTPDLGQGACQAIEDAATITALIGSAEGTNNIARALTKYDALRRKRTRIIWRRSRMVGWMAQSTNWFVSLGRNIGMKLFPNKLFGLLLLNLHRFQAPNRVEKNS